MCNEFTKVSETNIVDFENPSNSTVKATIDAASIDTVDAQRDGHLKSADFLHDSELGSFYPKLNVASS